MMIKGLCPFFCALSTSISSIVSIGIWLPKHLIERVITLVNSSFITFCYPLHYKKLVWLFHLLFLFLPQRKGHMLFC